VERPRRWCVCIDCWTIYLFAKRAKEDEDDSDEHQSGRPASIDGCVINNGYCLTRETFNHQCASTDQDRGRHGPEQVQSFGSSCSKNSLVMFEVEDVATQTELTGSDLHDKETAQIWLEKALSHLRDIPNDAERLVAAKQYGPLKSYLASKLWQTGVSSIASAASGSTMN
jgi:hypothetical protein